MRYTNASITHKSVSVFSLYISVCIYIYVSTFFLLLRYAFALISFSTNILFAVILFFRTLSALWERSHLPLLHFQSSFSKHSGVHFQQYANICLSIWRSFVPGSFAAMRRYTSKMAENGLIAIKQRSTNSLSSVFFYSERHTGHGKRKRFYNTWSFSH